MIGKVATGQHVPYESDQFMKLALILFNERIGAATARQYIQHFSAYYALSDHTAIDFACMYYRVGDGDTARRLLRDYGKNTFSISEAKVSVANGEYAHDGFDQKG